MQDCGICARVSFRRRYTLWLIQNNGPGRVRLTERVRIAGLKGQVASYSGLVMKGEELFPVIC